MALHKTQSVNGCLKGNSHDEIRWTAEIPPVVETRQPVPFPQGDVRMCVSGKEGVGPNDPRVMGHQIEVAIRISPHDGIL